MKYCPYCGNSLDDDMNYCPACGKQYKCSSGENGVFASETESPSPFPRNKDMAVQRQSPTFAYSRLYTKKGIVVCVISIIVIAVIGVLLFDKFSNFSTNTRKIEMAAKSVVLVSCYDKAGNIRSTGSGFVLYDDRTIVTNYHVVDAAVAINISTDEDHTFPVKSVIAYDIDKDIAILEAEESTGLKPLAIGDSSTMNRGSSVVAIGSPRGNKNSVSTGVLSGRTYNSENGIDELQFSAPISSGSSGGALFNDKGRVIGVTYAYLVDGQNLNLAIPVESVTSIYESRPANTISLVDFLRGSFYPESMYYADSEYVDFSELMAHPARYNGKLITTIAYLHPIETDRRWTPDGWLLPVGKYYFKAIESDYDLIVLDYPLELGYYINAVPFMTTMELSKDYSGYALVTGEFSVGRTENHFLWPSSDGLYLLIRYYETY